MLVNAWLHYIPTCISFRLGRSLFSSVARTESSCCNQLRVSPIFFSALHGFPLPFTAFSTVTISYSISCSRLSCPLFLPLLLKIQSFTSLPLASLPPFRCFSTFFARRCFSGFSLDGPPSFHLSLRAFCCFYAASSLILSRLVIAALKP